MSRAQQGGTVIRRPAGSVRTVVASRGDKTVVVRGSRGYVQGRVVVGRRAFVARTYSSGEVRAYRTVVYRGIPLAFYAPFGYYPVGYYEYARGPWTPIDYPWAWSGDPWYGYYGRYYRPYGNYPRPSYWLTDYTIARTLQNAYDAEAEARGDQDAAEAVDTEAPMSDEVKELVEAEVRRQLAEAQAEAKAEERGAAPQADAIPASFNDPGSHVFLASESLEVQDASNGESCVLSGGDAIQMKGGLPRSGDVVNVMVLSSIGSDCSANTTVSVPISELVEMHNHMRENLELGLEEMRSHQGLDSLPRLPASAAGEPRITAFAASFQPDPEVTTVLDETVGQADQIEGEILRDLGDDPPDSQPDAPAGVPETRESGLLGSLQKGQTESQVLAIMGQPLRASFLGGVKKLYEYRSGTVTFTDGELSEVEVSRAGGFVPPPQNQPPPREVERRAPAPTPVAPRTAPAARGVISVGMTESEVVAALGQPLRVSFLGGLQKMYEYRDRKVVFTDGSVSEVQ